jgi:hypothetical protein
MQNGALRAPPQPSQLRCFSIIPTAGQKIIYPELEFLNDLGGLGIEKEEN